MNPPKIAWIVFHVRHAHGEGWASSAAQPRTDGMLHQLAAWFSTQRAAAKHVKMMTGVIHHGPFRFVLDDKGERDKWRWRYSHGYHYYERGKYGYGHVQRVASGDFGGFTQKGLKITKTLAEAKVYVERQCQKKRRKKA
jgi:hypothetical protein